MRDRIDAPNAHKDSSTPGATDCVSESSFLPVRRRPWLKLVRRITSPSSPPSGVAANAYCKGMIPSSKNQHEVPQSQRETVVSTSLDPAKHYRDELRPVMKSKLVVFVFLYVCLATVATGQSSWLTALRQMNARGMSEITSAISAEDGSTIIVGALYSTELSVVVSRINGDRTQAWQRAVAHPDLPLGFPLSSPVLLADGNIVVAHTCGTDLLPRATCVTAMDSASGAKRWQNRFDLLCSNESCSLKLATDDHLYLISRNPSAATAVLNLDRNGTVLWSSGLAGGHHRHGRNCHRQRRLGERGEWLGRTAARL